MVALGISSCRFWSRCLAKVCRGLPVGLVLLAMQLPAAAADWPQFLGPQRNGISSETGLLDKLPSGGPKEVWRAEGGIGMSGLAIRAGMLATLVQKSGQQFVVAFDAKTGKPLWETSIAPEYKNAMGNGPRATATMTANAVFAFSGQGILCALAPDSGKILWKVDVFGELGGKPAEYGMACSPLVVDNLVMVTAGTQGGTLLGFDAKTGKLRWKAGSGTPGYSSPALREVGGTKQIIAFTGAGAAGVVPQSGEVLWEYPYKTDYDCNIATPLAYEGQVFISAGENHGSALLSLTAQNETFKVGEVWTSFGKGSVLRNEWQTSILLDGHLYGLDNVGSAGPVTHLTCVNAKTGKCVWQQPRFGKSNLIAADGKLFISTMKGELVVVRATTDGFDELGRAKVLGTTRQAPALANGRLYLRDDREIVCLDVRAK